VTGECVCPIGNVCCNPKTLAIRQAKEQKIRELMAEHKKLRAMLGQ